MKLALRKGGGGGVETRYNVEIKGQNCVFERINVGARAKC